MANYAAPLLIEAPDRPLRVEDLTRDDLELIRVINAEERLIDFIRYCWRAVEPTTPFTEGWAIEAIAEHLEAVASGEITRLIINVPPGFCKPVAITEMVLTKDRGRIPLGSIVIGDEVLSHTGRFCRVEAVHEQGVLPVVRVTTNAGRTLTAAPDHPVLTASGWKAAGDLTGKDVLGAVVPQEMRGKRLDAREARFLGYLVGDGSTKYAGVSFTNGDMEVLEDFEECAKSLGFSCKRGQKAKCNALVVYLSAQKSSRLRHYLERVGLAGKDSYTKRIPQVVMDADNDAVENFLGAYWSCDGTLAVRHDNKKTTHLASLTTVSYDLAKDTQHAMLRLGISTRVRSKDIVLESKRQPGGLYRSYNVLATDEHQISKMRWLQGLCSRKQNIIAASVPRAFETCLRPDPVISVEAAGVAECRCLTVADDHSFTANDLAVHNSLSTCVFLPAWIWGPLNRPSTRFLCASYSASLTERDNFRTTQLIRSPEYAKHWGDRFTANESMVKIVNNKTGWKLATSVGGVGTGERADIVLIDDPNSVKQAESETVRHSTNQWLNEVMPTRLSNPRSSAIVVIQQRTHEEDATGTLLSAEGGYEHLMIPMEWDGRRYSTGIGWTDPRDVDDIEPGRNDREWWAVRGELAFPARFPAWVVERDKKAMGSYAVAGQFQQAPSPRGGGIIKREWWQQWGPDDPKGVKFPPFDLVIGIVDGAYTTQNQNDPTAMAVLGTFLDPYSGMPKVMLAQCWAERMELHDGVQKIDETARKYRVSMLLVENKATGHSVVQELHRLFADKPYSVVLMDPRGSVAGRGGYDKVARAMSVVPIFEDEMVYAPRTDWAQAAIDELAIFPRGSHDDRCFVAGTMIATRRGQVSIEDVRTGDEVLTPVGFHRVLAVGCTGMATAIRVGALEATGNHPVFSMDAGYQRLDAFTDGKRWISLSLCGLIRLLLLSKSSSMASFTAGWADTGVTTCRSPRLMMAGAVRRACMWRSGKSTTGNLFLRSMKSITAMVILSTAIMATWSAYRRTCIAEWLGRRCEMKSISRTWRTFGRWLRSGTLRQKAENGIGSMRQAILGFRQSGLLSANYAASLEFDAALPLRAFVLEFAAMRRAGTAKGWFLSRSHAAGAAARSCLTEQLRASVGLGAGKPSATLSEGDGGIGRVPVFNLSVDGPRCYYANGVLVHNCDAIVGGLRWLRDQGALLRVVEAVDAEREMAMGADEAGRQPVLYRA